MFLFLISAIFLALCDSGVNSCTSKTTFKNLAGHNIKIIIFDIGGLNKDSLEIKNEEVLIKSVADFPDCPKSYRISYDSCIIIYNDSVQITHGSKSGISNCNSRNIFCIDSYITIKKEQFEEEFLYTFTEADYEFAKNR